MCYLYKSHNGTLIGGTKQDALEAMQAEKSQEHKQMKTDAISWRASIAGGIDPLTFKTLDKKEEPKLTQQLNRLIWRAMNNEIEELRHQISLFKHTNFNNQQQKDGAEEEIHRLQTFYLEDLVIRLRLPYLMAISNLKPKYEKWGVRQTKILKFFPRRLQRALPFAFKWWANKDLIKDPDERSEFEGNMKIFCPEDPKDFITEEDWKLLAL